MSSTPRVKDVAGLIDALSAAYRLDLEPAAYLQQLLEVSVPLFEGGLGVMAYTYVVADGGPPEIDTYALSERFKPEWLPPFYESVARAALGNPHQPTGFEAWGSLRCGQASAIARMRPILPHFSLIGGAVDAFAVNALDASGRGLWLGAPLPTTRRVPAARVQLFTRFASHLTSAFRLRRTLGRARPRPVAVLTPGGKMLHADSLEELDGAHLKLSVAAAALDRASSRRMRDDVEGATRDWMPLVDSRWALLRETDTDGKRLVFAVDNRPPTRSRTTDLSERELQVLTHARLGHSNKVIAYELGLAASTVRVLLHRAARKLGATTRAEAVARFSEHEQPDTRARGATKAFT